MSESSWADALCKVIAERDALAKQLATAREDALREAAEIADKCGVTPMTNVAHGGADWYRHGKEISRQILALIEEKTK